MNFDFSGLEDKWSLHSHDHCCDCGVDLNTKCPIRIWKGEGKDCMEIALCWECGRKRIFKMEEEEELITWRCKFCPPGTGTYEVRDTKKRTFAKAIDHLSNEHPEEYMDIIWKVAEEMEPIKVWKK